MDVNSSAIFAIESLERRALMAAVPTPDHVVIVMEENHDYGQIIGSPDAPFINSLAARGTLFANAHSIAHPSQPNYIALFSGSTHGVLDDNGPLVLHGPDLASELAAAGRTFAGYSEGLPAAGSLALQSGAYARKHNPWSDFTDVSASKNLPFSSFPQNYATLPTVSFVVPNLNDNMHDGTVAQADAWLRSKLGGYATWAQTHNSLLIVAWDENDSGDAVNRVPMIFCGQPVRAGVSSQWLNHYSTLRTMEDMYHLPYLGASAGAAAISGVWNIAPLKVAPVALSNLQWTSATVGWGQVQKNVSSDGNPLSLRGTTYATGIGTHADSDITYAINGKYSTFTSDIGVDDEISREGQLGSVQFELIGDGKVLYASALLTSHSATVHVKVSIAGVQKLTLRVLHGGDGIDYDHADWAGAMLA